MRSAPDFVFLDSGTGGIPYMMTLKDKSPSSRCLYLGDTIHFPYGEKNADEVARCADDSVQKIIAAWSPRVIVVACNTISVTALDALRAAHPATLFVGTVPAIKLAAFVTRNKRVGLLATSATINHPYTQRLIDDFAANCRVFKRADPALVSFVERALFTATDEEREAAVRPAAEYFCREGCDTVVLGCTHFTHIADDIRAAFRALGAEGVRVLDSREGVANRALDVIRAVPPRAASSASLPRDMSFFVTSLRGASELREYETLCRKAGIPFGGVLE